MWETEFFVWKCQRAYETENCFHCFFTWSKKAIYLRKYYCIFVSQHIILVLFGDIKLLKFSDFTKILCCYFYINQQVIILAKVELYNKRTYFCTHFFANLDRYNDISICKQRILVKFPFFLNYFAVWTLLDFFFP